MDIHAFWTAVLAQNAEAIRKYFSPDACVNWHNTNEHFTVEEFIRANCEYPGKWCGEVEREVWLESMVITATHVHNLDDSASFHVCSFIKLCGDKITAIDEYWGDDGEPPLWRKVLGLGTAIW